MASPNPAFESLSSADLLAATRDLVRQSQGVEAELLSHLGEIDERKLYLDYASSSMFAFCVRELGFSEDAAYNRITVARAGRRLPAVLESVRLGQVHLAGLRLLSPHPPPKTTVTCWRKRLAGPSARSRSSSRGSRHNRPLPRSSASFPSARVGRCPSHRRTV
jgi:hypothetical protein